MALRVSVIDLRGDMLRLLNQGEAIHKTEVEVWKAVCFGCCILDGTIPLWRERILVLHGTGATFKDMTFTGGAVLCAGANFFGTFQKCRFLGCALYIIHGASATLSDCTWQDCHHGLVAHGPATAITVAACAFTDCSLGVIAEAGATVTIVESTMHDTDTSVVVNDAGSRVTAADCTLRGMHTQPGLLLCGGSASLRCCSISWYGVAASVRGPTACLEVRGGHITKCPQAVDIMEHACVSCVEVAIHCAATAADPTPNAAVMLKDGQEIRPEDPDRPGPDPGFPAALLLMARCDIFHKDSFGVAALYGSRVALSLCRLDSRNCTVFASEEGSAAVVADCAGQSRGTCMAVSDGARLRVRGGVFTAAKAACASSTGAVLMVADARLSGGSCVAEGGPIHLGQYHGVVSVCTESTGVILRCEIGRGLVGVDASHGGRVRVKDTNVSNMITLLPAQAAREGRQPNPSAAYITFGGHVDVEGGAVRNCLVGCAVSPGTADAAATGCVRGVSFSQCVKGVEVGRGCEADVIDCTFASHEGIDPRNFSADFLPGAISEEDVRSIAVGFKCCRGGSMRGCSVEGMDRGVIAAADEAVRIQQCTFGGPGEPQTGVGVVAYSAVIEECTFEGLFQGVDVSDDDEDAVCEVRRCVFRSGVRHAVTAAEHAQVTVLSSQFHDVFTALFVGMGGSIAAQDCVCEGGEIPLRVGSGGGVLTGKRMTVRGGATAVAASRLFDMGRADDGPAGAPGSASVKLVDCELQGRERAVWASGDNVEMSLVKCALSAPRVGVGVDVAAGAFVRVRKSTVAGCRFGVTVGERDEMLRAVCARCGRGGLQALHDSRLALRRDAMLGVLGDGTGKRCAHQGARARAVLEDVVVQGCERVGVTVMPHGRVEGRRLRVSGCRLGVEVASVAGLDWSSFQDCTVAVPAEPEARAARRMQPCAQQQGFTIQGFEIDGVVQVDA